MTKAVVIAPTVKRASNSKPAHPVGTAKCLKGLEYDITVNVGGKTFHYYSYPLRLASEYFDTMLRVHYRRVWRVL
jgi:hypothetical protein